MSDDNQTWLSSNPQVASEIMTDVTINEIRMDCPMGGEGTTFLDFIELFNEDLYRDVNDVFGKNAVFISFLCSFQSSLSVVEIILVLRSGLRLGTF